MAIRSLQLDLDLFHIFGFLGLVFLFHLGGFIVVLFFSVCHAVFYLFI